MKGNLFCPYLVSNIVEYRKRKDLTETEEIKKWLEYTEKLYKKGLFYWDNHNGVITHIDPDILECEVRWALGNLTVNNASGND